MTKAALQLFEGDPLPLELLGLSTIGYGLPGSGKSTFARRLAEQAHLAGIRFCIVDPKGDSYGITNSADGRGAGLPVVIFGGDHAHLPLEAGMGSALGSTLARLPQSTILDLGRMDPLEHPRLLGPFFKALFDHNEQPILLICDEAQNYAGVVAKDASLDKEDVRARRQCLGAIVRIAKEGRRRSIGRVFITQRAPGLHVDIRELADSIAAFQMTGQNELDRVRSWLGNVLRGKELEATMLRVPLLEDGSCIFASSNKLMRQCTERRVLRPITFDSSATPKIGERRLEPEKISAPDLKSLRAALAGAVERAENEDPELLRRRLSELERELTAERSKERAPAPAKIERIEVDVPFFDEPSFHALFEEVVDELGIVAEAVSQSRGAVGRAMNEFRRRSEDRLVAANPNAPRTTKTVSGEQQGRPAGDNPVPTPPARSERGGSAQQPERATAGNGATPHRDPGTRAASRTHAAHPSLKPPEGWTMEEEELYQKFKARLLQEAPALLKLLALQPEIDVTVERKVVPLDATSMKGRIAILIANGFLDSGKRNGEIVKELARTGPTANAGRVSEALSDLIAMGIVTRAAGDRYEKNPDAKVTKTAVASS